MTQNLPPAKITTLTSTLALIALAATISACVTRHRDATAEAQLVPKASNAESALRVNLNTASAPELEKLPGIGKSIAERIVTHRKQYGPFCRAEHLMMVPGISDRKFRAIRVMITVE